MTYPTKLRARAGRHLSRLMGRVMIVAAVTMCTVGSEVHAGPDNPQVINGQVTFTHQGNVYTINASHLAIINYSSFNIDAGETVQFIQPGTWAKVLNRITGADPTSINGNLFANGQVYFVNPAGVIFGPNAVVDVGGLYAAAGSIKDRHFIDGIDKFTNLTGPVINYGSMTGHEVHLLGQHVGNHGTINTVDHGVLTMAAGNTVLLKRHGDRVLVKIDGIMMDRDRAPEAGQGNPSVTDQAAVVNTGSINSPDGAVFLGAGDFYSLAVNNEGFINAARGSIDVMAADGAIRNAGTISASTNVGHAGEVNVRGPSIVNAGVISADSHEGQAGRISLLAQNHLYMLDDSLISAAGLGLGHGGDVVANAINGVTLFADGAVLDVSGRTGGFAEVSGKHLHFAGQVNVNGLEPNSHGTLLIDPIDITVGNAGPDDGLINVNGELTFDVNPGDFVMISAAALEAINGHILLQATRDIRINEEINLTGQSMTLQAGRYVWLSETINGASSLEMYADHDFSAMGGPASDGHGLVFLAIPHLNVDGPLVLSGPGIKLNGDLSAEGIDLLGQVRFIAGKTQTVDAGPGTLFASHDLLMGGGSLVLRGNSIDLEGGVDVQAHKIIDGLGDLLIEGDASVAGDVTADGNAIIDGILTLDGPGDQLVMAGGLLHLVKGLTQAGNGSVVLDGGDRVDIDGDVTVGGPELTIIGSTEIAADVHGDGTVTFNDDVVVDGDDVLVSGDTVIFHDTIDGDANADSNLTVDAVLTVIDGNVGGNEALGLFRTTDSDNGDLTEIDADIIRADAVELDDAVVLKRDLLVEGTDHVAFGSTVDGAHDLTVRGGDILVGGDVGGNDTLTSIDLQVTKDDGLIDIAGNLLRAVGDILINAAGRIVVPDAATVIGRDDLTIESQNGSITLGQHEKVTVDGDLTMIAQDTITVGDLNARDDLTVDAAAIEILLRDGASLIDGDGTIVTDDGVDIIAGGDITFSVAPLLLGTGNDPVFATPTGEVTGTALDGFTVIAMGGTRDDLVLELPSGRVLDLRAVGPTITDVASSRGLFPLEPIRPDLRQDVLISISEIARLRSMGVNARLLSDREDSDRTNGRGFYDDIPRWLTPGEAQVTYAISRVPYDVTLQTFSTFEDVLGNQEAVVQTVIAGAWDDFRNIEGPIDAGDDAVGLAFRNFVANDTERADVLAQLDGLCLLLFRLRLLGLNETELSIAREYLLEPVKPLTMTMAQFLNAINDPACHEVDDQGDDTGPVK